jgi:hypothetical protein
MSPLPSDHDELRTTPLGASSEGAELHAELHVALKGSVTVVPVERGATVTIGRASNADVKIDDGSVSRRHAELHLGAKPTIVDLGSQNGTRVRGSLIEANTPVGVVLGEPFHVGLATLTLHMDRIAPGDHPSLLRRELRAHERERIRAALEKCGGNQTKAASLLGISRRTLVSRLSEHGLPRPRKG